MALRATKVDENEGGQALGLRRPLRPSERRRAEGPPQLKELPHRFFNRAAVPTILLQSRRKRFLIQRHVEIEQLFP
jgi:hypothetical protein